MDGSAFLKIVYNIINCEVCYDGKDNPMGVPAMKMEFERELQHRKREQESIQAKLDFEELTSRYKDIKSGKDSLIDEDEFWDSVEKIGY
jgi:hypothetical protein